MYWLAVVSDLNVSVKFVAGCELKHDAAIYVHMEGGITVSAG